MCRPKDRPGEIHEHMERLRAEPFVRREIYFVAPGDLAATARRAMLEAERASKGRRPSVAELVRRVKAGGDAAVEAAWLLVPRGRNTAMAADALIRALGDDNAGLRRAAATALGGIGPRARNAAPRLLEAAKGDRDVLVQRHAIHALGRLGEGAEVAVDWLTGLLGDGEKGGAAADSLGRIIDAPTDALLRVLRAGDEAARRHAAAALAPLGTRAAKAVPALREVYETTDSVEVKRAVAELFGAIGPEAKPAIPVLLETVKNIEKADTETVRRAIRSLGVLAADEPGRIVPTLGAMLHKHGHWSVYRRPHVDALHVLAGFGPAARPAVPGIAERLMSNEHLVTDAAAEALVAIAPGDPEVVEVFR
jgi:HEAT repeat protein